MNYDLDKLMNGDEKPGEIVVVRGTLGEDVKKFRGQYGAVMAINTAPCSGDIYKVRLDSGAVELFHYHELKKVSGFRDWFLRAWRKPVFITSGQTD